MARYIYRSAYKHGIDDVDILHAMDHAVVTMDVDEDKLLYLGWSTATNLLEVVSYLLEGDLEVVVHAMPMRRKYQRLLPGAGDPHD